MSRRRPGMLIAAFWEIIRFIAIFTLLGLRNGPATELGGRLALAWIAGPALTIAAASAAVGLNPKRNGRLIFFVVSAKVLGLLGGGAYTLWFARVSFSAAVTPELLAPVFVAAGLVLVDLLVIGYQLLLLAGDRKTGESRPRGDAANSSTGPSYPRYSERTVEDV